MGLLLGTSWRGCTGLPFSVDGVIGWKSGWRTGGDLVSKRKPTCSRFVSGVRLVVPVVGVATGDAFLGEGVEDATGDRVYLDFLVGDGEGECDTCCGVRGLLDLVGEGEAGAAIGSTSRVCGCLRLSALLTRSSSMEGDGGIGNGDGVGPRSSSASIELKR